MATASRIERIDDALLRPGRFDCTIKIDLPTAHDRSEILAIHLRRLHQDPAALDLNRHAVALDGFSGAEIEAAVVDAVYRSTIERTGVTDGHLDLAIRSRLPGR